MSFPWPPQTPGFLGAHELVCGFGKKQDRAISGGVFFDWLVVRSNVWVLWPATVSQISQNRPFL